MGWSEIYSSSEQYPYSSSIVDNGFPRSKEPPWGPPRSSHYPDTWQHHTKVTTTSHSWGVGSDNRSTSIPAPKTPLPVPPAQHDRDLTEGALAAAIVVPILVLFSAIGLAFMCLKRRKQDARLQDAPVVAAAGIKEKLGSFRRYRSSRIPPTAASAADPPILMSEQNNAYYTGLDTSSLGSSRGFSGDYANRASFEPPPPYIRDPSPPPVDGRARSPFDDPPDHQLFTEDSYANTEGSRRVSNPFISPAVSPISPHGVDESASRRVSDVSDADRR